MPDIIEKKYIDAKNTKVPIALYFNETKNKKVIFTGEHMELLLPYDNIDRRITTVHGKDIDTFGIFKVRLWNKPVDFENTPPSHETRYVYASKLITLPSFISKRNVNVNGVSKSYLVLTYKKNDVFIQSTRVSQTLESVKHMINIVFESFAPDIVRYEEYVDLLNDCARLNGINFGVNSKMIEMIIAELARDAKDLMTPLRKTINKVGLDHIGRVDYTMMKLGDLPHLKSTFTSISFQNIGYSIVASAKRHRNGEESEESPVEKILKY